VIEVVNSVLSTPNCSKVLASAISIAFIASDASASGSATADWAFKLVFSL
jgi:hypothetical protein